MGSVMAPSTDLFFGFRFLGGLVASFLSSLGMEGSPRPERIEARLVASLEVRLLAAF